MRRNPMISMTGPGLVVLALMLSGCSSNPLSGGDAPASNPGSSTFANTVFGRPSQVQPENAPLSGEYCPISDVRDGTAVHRVADGNDPNPLSLRYQATIVDTARECTLRGNDLVIKVGVEGRVIVGPKGGAGTINVPLRIALVKDLQTPVWTKLYTIPITIPAGSPNVSFTHVEENLVLQSPKAEDVQRYRIFVGFDEKGAPARRTVRSRRAQPN